MKITRLLSMCALFMVVAILFPAPCSCESFIDEPALQKGDVKTAYLSIEEPEMKGEEGGYEDNGEIYGTFPDEPIPLRPEDRQAEPSSRDKDRRDHVYSEDFEDHDYEDYNGEFPKNSKWLLSYVTKEEPAEGEDFAEGKFDVAVGNDEETDDWDVARNSERVGENDGIDLADEDGESRGEDAINANDPQNKLRPRKPQRRTRFLQCRRGQWYNPATQVCCLGRINYKTGPRVRCCGTFAYDVTSYICCRGRLRRRIGLSFTCCRTSAYSRISHLCCRGIIQRKYGRNPKCCGRRAYDAFRNRCCRNFIRPKNRRCNL